ncbi:TPA: hypothetical protein N6020_001065 [Escherichia coli]|nr:hypothetical protein [Escherichia coli]
MKQMSLIDMDGFLKGKCIPRDLKVNETNAEYLVRKFGELESKLETALRECRSAGITIDNLEAKCAALAAENAGLKAFKTAVYQQMGVGCDAPEFSITVGLSNLRRFADTLHAIEREFFTKELPDEEHEGETFTECPLSWGMSVEQCVSEFRKCLAEVRAQGVEMAMEHMQSSGSLTFGDCYISLNEFAAELRKGGNQ